MFGPNHRSNGLMLPTSSVRGVCFALATLLFLAGPCKAITNSGISGESTSRSFFTSTAWTAWIHHVDAGHGIALMNAARSTIGITDFTRHSADKPHISICRARTARITQTRCHAYHLGIHMQSPHESDASLTMYPAGFKPTLSMRQIDAKNSQWAPVSASTSAMLRLRGGEELMQEDKQDAKKPEVKKVEVKAAVTPPLANNKKEEKKVPVTAAAAAMAPPLVMEKDAKKVEVVPAAMATPPVDDSSPKKFFVTRSDSYSARECVCMIVCMF